MRGIGKLDGCRLAFSWRLDPWPPPVAPAAALVLRRMRAFDVPNGDKKSGGCSDPYVRFTLLDGGVAACQSSHKEDDENPVWVSMVSMVSIVSIVRIVSKVSIPTRRTRRPRVEVS